MLTNWYLKTFGVSAITGFLVFKTGIDNTVFRTLWSVFSDFISTLMIIFFNIGSTMLSLIPDLNLSEYSSVISTVMALGVTANSFLPIRECVILLLLFTKIRFVVMVFSFVKSLIPGMGN